MYCTVPKGPLRASTCFWRGSFFLLSFFLDRVGELAAAEEEKVFWFFLYLFFFGGGVFGTAAAVGFYLALSLSSSSSFFLSRAGEFGRGSEREERKRGNKGEKGSIRYIPQRSSFGLGERKERTLREVGREKYWSFFVFIYLYIYILFSCI